MRLFAGVFRTRVTCDTYASACMRERKLKRISLSIRATQDLELQKNTHHNQVHVAVITADMPTSHARTVRASSDRRRAGRQTLSWGNVDVRMISPHKHEQHDTCDGLNAEVIPFCVKRRLGRGGIHACQFVLSISCSLRACLSAHCKCRVYLPPSLSSLPLFSLPPANFPLSLRSVLRTILLFVTRARVGAEAGAGQELFYVRAADKRRTGCKGHGVGV